MGLEIYHNNPEATQALYKDLTKEYYGKKHQSLISGFATRLANEGNWHLIALDRGSKSPLGSTLLREEFQAPKNDPTLRKQAETQIWLGHSLISIEDMLATGTYDHNDFIQRMNLSIGAVAGNKFKIDPNEQYFPLDNDKYKSIIELAERDKSLSIYFEHDKWCLPEALRQALIDGKILSDVIVMAREYKPVMQSLLNLNNKVELKKDRPHQLATLDEFDQMIGNLTPKK